MFELWALFFDILCVRDDHSLFLWNLIKRDSERVQLPDLHCEAQREAYGFCYNLFEREFQVLRLWNTAESDDCSFASLYSVASRKWSKLSTIPYGVADVGGKFFNGHLIWPGYCNNLGWPDLLVSYNIRQKKFRSVSVPNDNSIDGSEFNICGLGILDGCLSVVLQDDKDDTGIWKMLEFGVKDSWVQIFSIPSGVRPVHKCWLRVVPLFLMKNRKVLIFCEERGVFSYNDEDKIQPRKLMLHDIEDRILEGITVTENEFIPHERGTPIEEVEDKQYLEQHLCTHPGSLLISEIEWGNGDTPRRSVTVDENSMAKETPENEPAKSLKRKASSVKESEEELARGSIRIKGDPSEKEQGMSKDAEEAKQPVDAEMKESEGKDAEEAAPGANEDKGRSIKETEVGD